MIIFRIAGEGRTSEIEMKGKQAGQTHQEADLSISPLFRVLISNLNVIG